MHNLYYLDLAYDSLPKDVYENNSFNNVEIMYKTGAKLYDNLKCFYSSVNGEHIVTVKSEDEKILHAIVKLY
jgi:medium-chain acyl-[acyl-carrier-protein] hydrolase